MTTLQGTPTTPSTTLRGYRRTDAPLLSGPWLPGELLGLPVLDRPALAEPATVDPPADHTSELCVLPGVGFARFVELDWVHRRARLEIGTAHDDAAAARQLLAAAVAHAFEVLHLHRLHGTLTPAAPTTIARPAFLRHVGFDREACVPGRTWLHGRPVDQEIWGMINDD